MFSTNQTAPNGDLLDLLSYLEAAFLTEIDQYEGIPPNFEGFLPWAKTHLSQVRPSEVFPVSNNYGVLLTNGQRIKLCPDAGVPEIKGSMANPDTGIQIVATNREGRI